LIFREISDVPRFDDYSLTETQYSGQIEVLSIAIYLDRNCIPGFGITYLHHDVLATGHRGRANLSDDVARRNTSPFRRSTRVYAFYQHAANMIDAKEKTTGLPVKRFPRDNTSVSYTHLTLPTIYSV